MSKKLPPLPQALLEGALASATENLTECWPSVCRILQDVSTMKVGVAVKLDLTTPQPSVITAVSFGRRFKNVAVKIVENPEQGKLTLVPKSQEAS